MTAAVAPDAGLVTESAAMMGGRVAVHLALPPDVPGTVAAAAARRVLARVDAWAGRLTRFSPASELCRLNADPRPRVPVGPTLSAVLDWARGAEAATDGIVDIALLDARLRAEGLPPLGPAPASRRWSLHRRSRGAVVDREPGVRFDLDGVAKGWLADRGLGLLAGWPSAVVDADGDVAVGVAAGESWTIGVADPRSAGLDLAAIRLPVEGLARRWGVATSGTSVFRWPTPSGPRHHLIDPRTGDPARTDVVQATVVAASARRAEAYAKTAVILGVDRALAALDRPEVVGLVLLTDGGDLVLGAGTRELLA